MIPENGKDSVLRSVECSSLQSPQAFNIIKWQVKFNPVA